MQFELTPRSLKARFGAQGVTYHIESDGRLFLIENVPARVNVGTGEKRFSPETVGRLQRAVWERLRPVRTLDTLVYEYESIA